MSWQGIAQIVVVLAALLVCAKPLGLYMARVFDEERLVLDKPLGWLERLVYRLSGVPLETEKREMAWTTYAGAMLLFNVAGIAVVYADAARPGASSAEPSGDGGADAGPLVEHRRQLRDQHRLAELRRRDDDELLHADGRRSPCRTSSARRRAWPFSSL